MSESESPSEGHGSVEEPEEELFSIIDETGEGFGFELTPEALMRPIAIGASTLFGIGMLGGIPFGLAMGRAQEGDGKGARGSKVRPSLEGLKFAATTFGLGTLLCAGIGLAGFQGVRWYYDVDSFEMFGKVMKEAVPMRRREMEHRMQPVLERVRRNAGEALPGPMRRLQERFHQSRFGSWIRDQVLFSVNIVEEVDGAQNGEAINQPSREHDSRV